MISTSLGKSSSLGVIWATLAGQHGKNEGCLRCSQGRGGRRKVFGGEEAEAVLIGEGAEAVLHALFVRCKLDF